MNNKKRGLMSTTILIICIFIIGMTFSKKSKNITHLSLDPVSTSFLPYITENTFEEAITETVLPSLSSLKNSNYLLVNDDICLYYESYIVPNSTKTIVISHGFTEPTIKYEELIYYFTSAGYSVYIPQHRGHGASTRLVEDPSLVHIKNFEDYSNDLKTFIDEVVLPENKEKDLFLYAHSMGGAIASLYLEENPGIMKAAILSSPMLEVNLGSLPNWLGSIISNTATLLGQGSKYVFTHGPFEDIPDFENSGTQSKIRYLYQFNQRKYDQNLQMNGASFSWIKEALSATSKAIKNAKKIKIPLLLFQADNDTYVKPGGQLKFSKRATNCEVIFVPDSKHELYTEKDEILFPYLDKVFEFLEEQ